MITTEYPETKSEKLDAVRELESQGYRYVESTSGDGYSGPESRGWDRYSDGCNCVDLVNPK